MNILKLNTGLRTFLPTRNGKLILARPGCNCYSGYIITPDGLRCYKTDTYSALGSTHTGLGIEARNVAYTNAGTIFFDPGYNTDGTTDVGYTIITTGIWKNPWPPGNITLGPMNNCGLWKDPMLDNESIHFSKCVDVPYTKTYYVGMGCDNYATVKIDGTLLIQQDYNALSLQFGYSSAVNFKYWFIYPVTLDQGFHAFELRGTNEGGPAGLGAEIYDATVSELISAPDFATLDLYSIFSTKDYRGEYIEFFDDDGGYYCTEGYSLVMCDGPAYCIKTEYLDCGEEPTSMIVNYGLLYNRYVILDTKNIANIGWHVPTVAEYELLITHLGETITTTIRDIGTTYWTLGDGNNLSKFNGRGSGSRTYYDGTFFDLKIRAYIWALDTDIFGHPQSLEITKGWCMLANQWEKSGFSIRLIKDSTDLEDGEEGIYIGNDGNVYRTICIGTQEWLADNLCEIKYRTGDMIPIVTGDIEWTVLTTGALCAYDNDWDNV